MATTLASGLGAIARVVSTAGIRISGPSACSRSSDTAMIRVSKTLRLSFNSSDKGTIARNLPFRLAHVSRLSRSNSRSRLSPINFCNLRIFAGLSLTREFSAAGRASTMYLSFFRAIRISCRASSLSWFFRNCRFAVNYLQRAPMRLSAARFT